MRILFLVTVLLCGQLQPASARQKPKGTITAPTPMSCRIEGTIVKEIKSGNSATGPCARYACAALVKVLSVQNCGQSVSSPLNEGDTVMIRFAYTLHPTTKLFPDMKVYYPGLKKGNTFVANAEQRLQMGGQPYYEVSGYTVK